MKYIVVTFFLSRYAPQSIFKAAFKRPCYISSHTTSPTLVKLVLSLTHRTTHLFCLTHRLDMSKTQSKPNLQCFLPHSVHWCKLPAISYWTFICWQWNCLCCTKSSKHPHGLPPIENNGFTFLLYYKEINFENIKKYWVFSTRKRKEDPLDLEMNVDPNWVTTTDTVSYQRARQEVLSTLCAVILAGNIIIIFIFTAGN